MLEIKSVALNLNSDREEKKKKGCLSCATLFHSSVRDGIPHRLLIQNLATDNEDFGHV